MTETPAADNSFVEGNHPDAYDPRGNFNGNQEQSPATDKYDALAATGAVPPRAQVAPVASEAAGYLAPGGGVRQSIRDRIAAARPYVAETVEVPEWDSTIEVRSISLGERQAVMADIMGEDGTVNTQEIEAQFILACSYDPETGEKVFSHDDLAFIQSRAAGPADRVGKAAMRLSGMGATEETAKKS